MPNLDAIEKMLQAFSVGNAMFQANKNRELRAREHDEETKLKQKAQNEAIRQFNEGLAQRAEDRKLTKERIDLLHKTSELAARRNAFDEKQLVMKGITEGRFPIKRALESVTDAQGLQMPNLSAPQDMKVNGVKVGADEIQTPQDFLENSPEYQFRRDQAKQKFDQDMLIEDKRQGGRTALQKEALKSAKEIAGAHDAAAWARAKLTNEAAMARVSAQMDGMGISPRAKTTALGVANNWRNSQMAKQAEQFSEDRATVKNILGKINSATGPDDMALTYLFARNMDRESTVRDGERVTAEKNAQGWKEKFGVDVKNILDGKGKATFSPQARARILSVLAPRMKEFESNYKRAYGQERQKIQMVSPMLVDQLPLYDPLNLNNLNVEDSPAHTSTPTGRSATPPPVMNVHPGAFEAMKNYVPQ